MFHFEFLSLAPSLHFEFWISTSVVCFPYSIACSLICAIGCLIECICSCFLLELHHSIWFLFCWFRILSSSTEFRLWVPQSLRWVTGSQQPGSLLLVLMWFLSRRGDRSRVRRPFPSLSSTTELSSPAVTILSPVEMYGLLWFLSQSIIFWVAAVWEFRCVGGWLWGVASILGICCPGRQ